ncbi:MAG: hypothetical protein PHS45_02030 [Bacilli bacterium]|nr:hypothetical protein [Bacilli bacterium]
MEKHKDNIEYNLKQEQVLVDIIKDIILKNNREIAEIKEDLAKQESSIENSNTIQELNEVEKDFNVLLDRLKKLEEEYKDLFTGDIFKYLVNTEYKYLVTEILNDYMKDLESNVNLEDKIKKYEKDFSVIKEIIELQSQKDDIKLDLVNKNKQLRERDYQYQKSEITALEIEKIKDRIEYDLNHQQKYISELAEEIKYITPVEKITTRITGLDRFITNAAKAVVGVSLCNNPVGLVVGAVFVSNAVRGMRNSIRTEQVTSYIASNDLEKELVASGSILNYIEKTIDKSLSDISALKMDFKTTFRDYINVLPEYTETLDKIEALEVDLLDQQKEIKKTNQTLDEELDKNIQYVKGSEARTSKVK